MNILRNVRRRRLIFMSYLSVLKARIWLVAESCIARVGKGEASTDVFRSLDFAGPRRDIESSAREAAPQHLQEWMTILSRPVEEVRLGQIRLSLTYAGRGLEPRASNPCREVQLKSDRQILDRRYRSFDPAIDMLSPYRESVYLAQQAPSQRDSLVDSRQPNG